MIALNVTFPLASFVTVSEISLPFSSLPLRINEKSSFLSTPFVSLIALSFNSPSATYLLLNTTFLSAFLPVKNATRFSHICCKKFFSAVTSPALYAFQSVTILPLPLSFNVTCTLYTEASYVYPSAILPGITSLIV